MIVKILMLAVCLLLAGYGAYVLFGHGEVVRVEAPKVSVENEKDKASITIEKPDIVVEKK